MMSELEHTLYNNVMEYEANFYFHGTIFTFDWNFMSPVAFNIWFQFHLIPRIIFRGVAYINIIRKWRCQVLSDNFFVYKINRHSVELPPPVWFRKFYGAQCFIHTFTRGEFEGRLNIYDCRGISTTVTLPAPLYSDIQTHHPYDCKSPDW